MPPWFDPVATTLVAFVVLFIVTQSIPLAMLVTVALALTFPLYNPLLRKLVLEMFPPLKK